jgi:hypothetical protein
MKTAYNKYCLRDITLRQTLFSDSLQPVITQKPYLRISGGEKRNLHNIEPNTPYKKRMIDRLETGKQRY